MSFLPLPPLAEFCKENKTKARRMDEKSSKNKENSQVKPKDP